MEERDRFIHCQLGIKQMMVAHAATTHALRQIAAKTADRLEEEASRRAHLKLVKWMQEGPAAGLGRQHKMSRVATGWIPNCPKRELTATTKARTKTSRPTPTTSPQHQRRKS